MGLLVPLGITPFYFLFAPLNSGGASFAEEYLGLLISLLKLIPNFALEKLASPKTSQISTTGSD